jgi:hypothetical protein
MKLWEEMNDSGVCFKEEKGGGKEEEKRYNRHWKG